MTPDLKNLIDSIEKENLTRQELETTVEYLKEEISRLTFTIKEMKALIHEQEDQLEQKGSEATISGDAEILKDMIRSQREDLKKKDLYIDELEEKIDDLLISSSNGEKVMPKELTSKEQEELLEVRQELVKLTEEIDLYQNNDANARKSIEHLAEENNQQREIIDQQKEQLGRLTSRIQYLDNKGNEDELVEGLKKVKEENGRLQEELDELKSKLSELTKELDEQKSRNIIKKASSSQISDIQKEEIERLQLEVEDLQDQVITLHQNSENARREPIEQDLNKREKTNDDAELEGLKKKIIELEEENTTIQRNLRNTNGTIERLIGEVEGYVKEISEMDGEIQKRNSRLSGLNIKIEGLQEKNILLTNELAETIVKGEEVIGKEESNQMIRLDSWYEEKTSETINRLKKENEKLIRTIKNLEEELANPLVFVESSDKGELSMENGISEEGDNYKEAYEELTRESQELIEENQKLHDIIDELKENQADQPIIVGQNLSLNDSEVNLTERVKSLEVENQDLLDKVLELNLNLQESRSNSNSMIKNLEEEKHELIERIEKLNHSIQDSKSPSESKIKNLEQQNKNLEHQIEELSKNETEGAKSIERVHNVKIDIPQAYQDYLLMKALNLLPERDKEVIYNTLLRDLKSKNPSIKRFAIGLISETKEPLFIQVLENMINDKDWIIRLSLVKAFSKLGNEGAIGPLKKMAQDKDVDVKEAAMKALEAFPKNLIEKFISEKSFLEEFEPNKWNWSQEIGKWVFIKIKPDGTKEYQYRLEPPETFVELSVKLKLLNEKMMQTKDLEERAKIFQDLMKISKKMQETEQD